MRFKRFTANFYYLILGRSVRNIADSFYMIALAIGLVTLYDIKAGELSLFTLIGLLPSLFSAFYGHRMTRIRQDKRWLLMVQLAQLLTIVAIILVMSYKVNVLSMYLLNFLFSLETNLLNTLQMKIVPQTLDYDDSLIEKSVDIQYISSNVLDIVSNFIASMLLGVISYLVLLQMSLPFFIGAVYFMSKIKLARKQNDEQSQEQEIENRRGVAHAFHSVKQSKFAASIILIEAILSAGTSLLLALIPVYIVEQGYSIAYLGLVLGLHRIADLLGALLAPKIKMPFQHFFALDYILSGTALFLVFVLPNAFLKLVLFFIAFVIIGISGNMFEKMIYNQYHHSILASIYTAISSVYSFFGILFLLIPLYYANITVIGEIINAVTVAIGLVLLFFRKRDRK